MKNFRSLKVRTKKVLAAENYKRLAEADSSPIRKLKAEI